jgi:hypothetical protein
MTTVSTRAIVDLRDGQLADDDTGDRTVPLRREFQPSGVDLRCGVIG